VQVLPDPPTNAGAIVQLGERLLCKQEVAGSIPAGSTSIEIWPKPFREPHAGAMLRLFLSAARFTRVIFRSHGEHEAVLLFNNLENSLF
jgi:hypothetical protein